MTISLIVAMSRKSVIGVDNKLPWSLKADLAYFKRLTLNHPIIMGRRTLESIGKPLSNRTNIILTRDASYHINKCYTYNSIEDILNEYNSYTLPDEEVFIIGGSSIFSQFLPYADKMYITYIDHEFEGDSHFPEYDKSEWKLVSSTKGVRDELNDYDYYFNVYERVNNMKSIQNGTYEVSKLMAVKSSIVSNNVYEITKLIAEYKENEQK